LEKNIKTELQVYTYSITHSKADFYIENLQLMNGIYHFDIHGPSLFIKHAQLQMPGLVNIENALAAAAISHLGGEQKEMIRHALSTFKGVKRRMEYIIKRDDLVYLDDYAHHPEELRASITSVKALYPSQKIIGIFQPHLFSRTRDFLDEFATSLALLDHLVLLDIYPAREQAIVGVSSQELLKKIIMKEKVLLKKEEVIPYLKGQEPQVILSLGAGDIDRLVSHIKTAFE